MARNLALEHTGPCAGSFYPHDNRAATFYGISPPALSTAPVFPHRRPVSDATVASVRNERPQRHCPFLELGNRRVLWLATVLKSLVQIWQILVL
ncbi:hypothetical protein EVAR_99291_1 [Eumeta japonica]|uniref:Uncharacterized protein n=1 Tax=Eumeta variegata TaxID=151549 RepID=A0A4C2A5T8_EUMVA|nr:hypothetical protein EVAR_99291_1 [Eumeta japonica]